MSDVDYEDSKEDEETDEDDEDDEDDDDDDDDYSVDTNDNGDEDDTEKVADADAEPRVLRRAPSRKKLHGENGAEKAAQQDNVMMSEAGSREALDPGNGDAMPGRLKRQRLHGKRGGGHQQAQQTTWDDIFKLHGEDWNEESEDDDWCPIGALRMPSHWFCTNCNMPNSERLWMCGVRPCFFSKLSHQMS